LSSFSAQNEIVEQKEDFDSGEVLLTRVRTETSVPFYDQEGITQEFGVERKLKSFVKLGHPTRKRLRDQDRVELVKAISNEDLPLAGQRFGNVEHI